MSSNLVRRILVALVGIPAAIGCIYLGSWPLAIALGVLGAVGTWEACRLIEATGPRPLSALGVLAGATAPLGTLAVLEGALSVRALVILVVLWALAVWVAAMRLRPLGQGPTGAIAGTVLAAAYAGGLPGFALYLRHADAGWGAWTGTAVVFLPIVVVWVTDIAAMAAGATFGGRRLAPVLSPKKTWAGAIGGTVGGLVAAPVFGMLMLPRVGLATSLWSLAGFGLVISVVAQVGDAAESLVKRDAGVKDSGRFFSGHGGVLDRLDALYWALPAATGLLALMGVV